MSAKIKRSKGNKVSGDRKSIPSKKNKFDPINTYQLSTKDLNYSKSKVVDAVADKISIEKSKSDRKRSKQKQFKDLGLHEDFDPNAKYSLISREIGIKTWKDFFLVYFVMALSVFAFIAILVSYGYLINPIELYSGNDVAYDFTYVPNPNFVDGLNEDVDNINYDSEQVLTIDTPLNNSVLISPIYADGTAAALFGSVDIVIYDNQDNKVSETTAFLFGNDPDLRQWITILNITRSPRTKGGYILVFPSYLDEKSKLAQYVPFEFNSKGNGDIRVLGPIENQLSNGDNVGIFIKQLNEAVTEIKVSLLSDSSEILLSEDMKFENGEISQYVSVPQVNGTESIEGQWVFEYGNGLKIEVPMKFQSINSFQ